MSDRQLPVGDRDEIEPQGLHESGPAYMKRLLRQDHGIDPDEAAAKARPWRRWMGRPGVQDTIDRIFDGKEPREPGCDDE